MDGVSEALPILGVVVGTVMGAWLTAAGETRRWRRERTFQLYQERRDYFARAVAAVDQQFVVMGQCADAVRGERRPVPVDRVSDADNGWRGVLSERGMRAAPDLQQALGAFDQARSDYVEAINSRDEAAMTQAAAPVDLRRQEVLTAIQAEQQAMIPHLSRHILPLRVRAWRGLRRKPLDYL